MKKQIRIYIYIIGLILIDQLSKVWALSALRGTEGIAVIPNVFELFYLENRGAAFGILQDHQIFFVLITVAAAVILTWIYRRIPQTKKYIPLRISYALIMAGAFGNLDTSAFDAEKIMERALLMPRINWRDGEMPDAPDMPDTVEKEETPVLNSRLHPKLCGNLQQGVE